MRCRWLRGFPTKGLWTTLLDLRPKICGSLAVGSDSLFTLGLHKLQKLFYRKIIEMCYGQTKWVNIIYLMSLQNLQNLFDTMQALQLECENLRQQVAEALGVCPGVAREFIPCGYD